MPNLIPDVDAPSIEDYKRAFRAIRPRMTDEQFQMLAAHFKSVSCVLTSRELAQSGGYDRLEAANSQYGRLGSLLASELGFRPGQASSSFATFYKPEEGEWRWELRPQVVKALQELDWF
jgi:hypothetical protein